jgi:predicted small secreted protein
MMHRLRFVTLMLAACAILLAACDSPEAVRTRGGGPGADVKNWGHPVELHAGAEPYYDTPCETERVECRGPLPIFGPTPPPD